MKKFPYNSPLGAMTILADDHFLYGLWFNDQKHFGGRYDLDEIVMGMTDQAQVAISWLNRYFSGQNPSDHDLHLNPQTTAFQSQVYQALGKVPYGQTTTYKDLSDAIQAGKTTKKNLSRAIGNAVGHNPILLIIPCHRVLGSDGSLTGYAGGIERKKSLLKLETDATWR